MAVSIKGPAEIKRACSFKYLPKSPLLQVLQYLAPKVQVVASAIKVIPPMRLKTSMFMKKLKPPFSRANP